MPTAASTCARSRSPRWDRLSRSGPSFSHIGRNLNGMQYYFDTKKSRKGPEYGAIFYRAKDGDRVTGVHVYRARSWTKPGKELTCMTKSRWKINPNGTGTFTAWFGPGCLEFHGNKRLRASVRSWDYTKYVGQGEARRGSYGHTDVMRAKRSFSRWVRDSAATAHGKAGRHSPFGSPSGGL